MLRNDTLSFKPKLILLFSILVFILNIYPQPSKTCLYFNGSTSSVYCGNDSVFTPANAITISVWMKTLDGQRGQTILWRGDVWQNYYGIKTTDVGQLRGTLFLDQYTHIFSQTKVQSNVWYNVTMTYDNNISQNNFKLYVNGQLESSISASGTIKWDSNPLLMGEYPWSNPYIFYGYLEDIQIWNRALSQNEILQKMNQTLNPQNEQGLVAYWPANEGQGSILHDLSGNGNDGIINNAGWYPNNSVLAEISAPKVWLDSNFDGFADQRVSAANSIGDISSYIWTVGNDTIATGITPVINLPTGSQYLVLTVKNDSGGVSKDSIMVSVYAAKVNTNGPIYSAVSQLNSNTFFVSSADDKVYQFDSSGTVKWTYLTGGDIQSTVTVSDSGNIFVTSSDTRLYSFNNLGTPNWDKAMGGVIVSSPTIDKDNSIMVGLTTGRLFALSYHGNIKWNFQANDAIVSSPVIGEDGTVYFGSKDKNLYAVSSSGNLLWNYATMDSIVSSPALGADHSVIIGSKDGYLYKFNEKGELEWKFNTAGAIYSAPIIGENGQIFIGSSNGFFYSVSSNGDFIWKYDTKSSIKSTASMSPDGSTIFVGNENGYIFALTIYGNLKWYLKADRAISSPTLITNDNILFVGSLDGSVYIMRANSNIVGKKNLEWPTFLGNNQRTGDQKTLVTDIKNNENTIHNFSLMQNFPNPFNPTTVISFTLPLESSVKIRIYNVLGEIVKEFNLGKKETGSYQINWNASNVSSGVYFYSMEALPANGTNGYKSVRKMILIK